MILDPGSLEPRDLHRLLIGAIVPRPIAFVSTVGNAGPGWWIPWSSVRSDVRAPTATRWCAR